MDNIVIILFQYPAVLFWDALISVGRRWMVLGRYGTKVRHYLYRLPVRWEWLIDWITLGTDDDIFFARFMNESHYPRWWCDGVGPTGVCTDRHLATSLITSSQPLVLLLAAAVYDLPTGTVSLCLAVDSARTAVGRSIMSARQSGTRCQMNLEILTVLIVLNGSWKQFCLPATSVTSALDVIFIMRCAI